MFKSIANFFRGADWTDGIIERFDTMLGLAEENFKLCADHLVDADDIEKIRDDIYSRDRKINSMERDLRRRVISHFAACPSEHEIPTAFILTTLVKDAERIGDYVKNLYEVHQIHGETGFQRKLYDVYYDGIRTQVKQLFSAVRQAFRNSSAEEAHAAIAAGRETMRRCESAIRAIAAGGHSVPESIALVLAGRHYKRILAHLVNIATSVVMPADRVDYYDEMEAPGEKPE
ncbi:MAG: PhoU domain-containing protein [Acidobacteriota bacterium]